MIIIKNMRWISIGLLIGLNALWEPRVCAQQASTGTVAAAPTWKPEPLPADAKVGNWKSVTDKTAGTGSETIKVQRVAVGDVNNVWAIAELASGKDNAPIYQLGRESEKEEERWIQKAEGIDVSVGQDGTVIIIKDVDGKNKLFERKVEDGKESWDPIFPESELTRVSVASKDSIWGVLKQDKKYKAYRLKEGTLVPIKTVKNEDASGFVMFSLASNEAGEDVIFGIDIDGNMYRFDLNLVKAIQQTEQIRKDPKFQEHVQKAKHKKGRAGKGKAKTARIIQRDTGQKKKRPAHAKKKGKKKKAKKASHAKPEATKE